LECDNYLHKLAQLYSQMTSMSNSQEYDPQALNQLRDIASRATQPFSTKSIMLLQQLDQQANAFSVSHPNLSGLVTELSSWILYKEQVLKYVNSTTALMKTLFGGARDGISMNVELFSTRVPSVKDFEIIKPITKGGFARVYLARKADDLYAIKVLNKQDIGEKTQMEHVLGERNILATTSCPFVVRLFYAFQTNVCGIFFTLLF
jgi:hypothetical protein